MFSYLRDSSWAPQLQFSASRQISKTKSRWTNDTHSIYICSSLLFIELSFVHKYDSFFVFICPSLFDNNFTVSTSEWREGGRRGKRNKMALLPQSCYSSVPLCSGVCVCLADGLKSVDVLFLVIEGSGCHGSQTQLQSTRTECVLGSNLSFKTTNHILHFFWGSRRVFPAIGFHSSPRGNVFVA